MGMSKGEASCARFFLCLVCGVRYFAYSFTHIRSLPLSLPSVYSPLVFFSQFVAGVRRVSFTPFVWSAIYLDGFLSLLHFFLFFIQTWCFFPLPATVKFATSCVHVCLCEFGLMWCVNKKFEHIFATHEQCEWHRNEQTNKWMNEWKCQRGKMASKI